MKKEPAITYFASNIGKGNPRIYYNEVPENERSEYAQIFVQLDNHTAPDKKMAIIESLRKKWTPYPGAKIEVKNFEQGPPVVAPVEVRVFGDNLDTLRSLAARVENMLQNTDGTIYIDNPVDLLKSDIKVDINKEKAQLLGIQTVNIDRTVRLAVAGLNMGKYTDDNDKDYSILLTRTKEEIPTLDVFNNLYVNNNHGCSRSCRPGVYAETGNFSPGDQSPGKKTRRIC